MQKNLFTLILMLAITGPLAARDPVAIKGGRILPLGGLPLEKGVVLSNKGKNEAGGKGGTIGKDLDDARAARATQKKVADANPADKPADKPGNDPPPDSAADDPTQQRRPRPMGGGAGNFGAAPDAALVREALTKLLK